MAEIVIFSYSSSMIFSGLFSILVYTKGQVKSILMQVYVIINSIYAVGAIAIICLALSISYSEKYTPPMRPFIMTKLYHILKNILKIILIALTLVLSKFDEILMQEVHNVDY